ncbi:6-phosphogluconolactonase, cycloisomerase 2 family [Saccharopolyspora kobensis]|uniref:6-phosphogluconolactonase, cycloisomerase 2 family n=1 Tax=Saccharopolyspora kobensis TaxID=146035 RepID=A0A1H6DQS5_9PSEU|nr:lactonase family protein [Saccharopolyspora kobensis]SEG87649.1 6-phosphogluconolactonase, cycloisomerase 2 family [Saccharopolyspora kobensis]SFE05655.1 6-phosphogluconolactonase, cycloisomerase 2 family [Saccharopolyspora kobensis]
MPDEGEYRVYLGAYTGADSAADGIRSATADGRGSLRCAESVAEIHDPSFLALAPDGSTLFAVSEQRDGRVFALQIRDDGTLRELNSQPTLGAAPCHLSVHPSGKYLLTANYESGNVVVHPIDTGGVLREPCHVVQHSGSGPNPQRQEGPHAHQVLPDPTGRFVLAVDLGTDSVYSYDFDESSGHLALRHELSLRAGTGPRHLAFHPDGERAYLLNELASSVTELGYDPSSGALEPRRTLSALPPDYGRPSLAAEVVVTPDGRFVLTSNRGHDSIAVFRADASDGEFRLLGIHSAGVAEPRHIALSPDGRVLFAAGQRSDDVQAFAISPYGELTPLGDPVATPTPVCILPVP